MPGAGPIAPFGGPGAIMPPGPGAMLGAALGAGGVGAAGVPPGMGAPLGVPPPHAGGGHHHAHAPLAVLPAPPKGDGPWLIGYITSNASALLELTPNAMREIATINDDNVIDGMALILGRESYGRDASGTLAEVSAFAGASSPQRVAEFDQAFERHVQPQPLIHLCHSPRTTCQQPLLRAVV